jgi:hypothetical protein
MFPGGEVETKLTILPRDQIDCYNIATKQKSTTFIQQLYFVTKASLKLKEPT